MSEPDPFSRQLTTINPGEYISVDFTETSFGQAKLYWFQIEVEEQIGWVMDNVDNIKSKSSACP